jgi:hypothetical protein
MTQRRRISNLSPKGSSALLLPIFAVGALAVATLLAHPAPAQQVPGASQGVQVQQAQPTPDLPGLRRFQIKEMIPAEQEAFMHARASELTAHPPQDVPPLPEQQITPVAPRGR